MSAYDDILDDDIKQAGGHLISMTNLQLIRELRLLRSELSGRNRITDREAAIVDELLRDIGPDPAGETA